MPFAAKSFTDPDYHSERLGSISYLDKVASYILALNWSVGGEGVGSKPSRKLKGNTTDHQNFMARQLESHLDCVAVAHLDGIWYFASNRLKLTADNINQLAVELDVQVTYHLMNVTEHFPENMHAEMKVLKFLKLQGKLVKGVELGVSKPCCSKCKAVLDQWEIKYTSFHTVPVQPTAWVDPALGTPS